MSDEEIHQPQPPMPPTTTAQEDITTAGQRRVNLIWEYTQAFIAVIVVAATMGSAMFNVFTKNTMEIPNIIAAAFGIVVGSYFQRTNHMNVGGVGPKPAQKYEGR
jgi:hypothetical protein